jgi:hypothetical protein
MMVGKHRHPRDEVDDIEKEVSLNIGKAPKTSFF